MTKNKECIILKLSGAALRDKIGNNILSSSRLQSICKQIKQIHSKYDIGIVVGGGNI
jgi:uridylate kinase